MVSLSHWRRALNQHLLLEPLVQEVLSHENIEACCRQAGHRWRETFWSPVTTVLTFLLQVLSAEKTLRAAVSSLLAQLNTQGQNVVCSSDPSAYCQARRRLPGQVVESLNGNLAEQMTALVGPEGRWHGHPVKIVDGSCVSMPDTPELQKVFPQPEAQKPGCGFPVARLVALFDWASGAILRLAIGNLLVSELALFRKNRPEWLPPNDVLVADRYYCAYGDLVQLQRQGVFVIFRQHQRRKTDFRKGQRLGPDDQLVTWRRPGQWIPSCGLTREEFEALPEQLTIRQIRITEVPKGFRSRIIVVVTTLLDPVRYPAEEIRALFRDRWMAELNLRSLKTHLGMDVLHGENPDVVGKEILLHLLAYNLIRLLMWRAARRYAKNLHRLSFTGTLHRLRRMMSFGVEGRRSRTILYETLLQWIANDEVPYRPNRLEPRRKKRRPKEYSLLNKPRSWYRRHGDPDVR